MEDDAAPDALDLCRYCDRLPDCEHICDRCRQDAHDEQEAQREF